MKEIGGYFGLETLANNEYYKDLIALNSARSALLYIIKAKGIEKLYIPYFLCDSVSKLCDREMVAYDFYHIGKDLFPVFNKTLGESDYLYIVNYYGQLGNEVIYKLKEKYENIIIDNVQAFFQPPVDGVDTVYSCRKYFGVPDGAYVATKARIAENLPIDVSMDRMRHILGRYEGKCASDYYDDYKKSESSFAMKDLLAMSALTHNILGAIDYGKVRKKRDENFAVLDSVLGAENRLSLKTPAGAFAYPFYHENGMELKRDLIRKKIYIATLWPNVLEQDQMPEKDFAGNILPLPCDQRYGKEDMLYVAHEVLNSMS